MSAEFSIAAQGDSGVRHLDSEGTDQALRVVLDDLDEKVRARRIGPEFHRWLRGMILASPHFRGP